MHARRLFNYRAFPFGISAQAGTSSHAETPKHGILWDFRLGRSELVVLAETSLGKYDGLSGKKKVHPHIT